MAIRAEVLFLPQTSSLKHREIMVTWAPGTPAVGVGNRIPLQGNKVEDDIAEDSRCRRVCGILSAGVEQSNGTAWESSHSWTAHSP